MPVTVDGFQRIDRLRPKRKPYRSFDELQALPGSGVTNYIEELYHYLEAKQQISKSESYYLYFLGNYARKCRQMAAAEMLSRITSNCQIVDLEFSEMDLGAMDIEIPGLGNVIKANWRFLPQPENLSAEGLIDILKEHASHFGNIDFDLARIRFALKQGPKQICVGIEEFAGYYAFLFEENKVLFECPVYGNAAYVVKGDWRELSQQYKGQLERRGSRVIHRRYWQSDVKEALRNI